MPWLWLIGGVNGAGKTTLSSVDVVRERLEGAELLNPDDVAADLRLRDPALDQQTADLRGAEFVMDELGKLLRRGESVVVETVLSSDKYLPSIKEARALGYSIGLIFVALRTVEQHVERVRFRVSLGGHAVAEEKIRKRWHGSHERLAVLAPGVDALFVFDNSAGAPRLIAYRSEQGIELLDREALPEVTLRLAPLIQG